MLLLSGIIGGWTASILLTRAAPAGGFTFAQYLAQGRSGYTPGAPLVRLKHTPPVPNSGGAPTDYAHLPPSAEPATMKPLSQALATGFVVGGAASTSTTALDLMSSDQRLEVQLQPGSLDMTRATIGSSPQVLIAPTGGLTLQITQLSGHFAGSVNQLGSYQLQVVDGSGKVVSGIAMSKPVTIVYHYQPSELQALNLSPDSMLLTWSGLLAAAQQAKQSTKGLSIKMQNDPTAHTLSAQTTVLGPGPFDVVGPPQNQSPPKPHLASVQGNAGQLSYGYPLQVVPGPDGFTPQLSLNYSSGDTNGRSSRTAPANDVGEGWSLSLGSISADVYPSGSADARTWYFMSGVGNVSDRLVPNPTPVEQGKQDFLTEHISQLRIRQTNPTTPMSSCFQVWDTSGTEYDFGCTSDALQFRNDATTGQTPYRWDLDRIIAPNEGPAGPFKIIQIKYLQDCTPSISTCTTVRDAAIKQVIYGFGASTSTIDTVAGTVDFSYLAPYAQLPWASAYSGSGYSCSSGPPQSTTLRCDDPLDYNGGLPGPPVMSTLSLMQVKSYVGKDDGTGSIAYSYALNYQDSYFQSAIDDLSGAPKYVAGEHLLTQVTPSVYQSGTAHQLQPLVLSYAYSNNNYSDTQHTAWNGQIYSQFTSWEYLTQVVDLNKGSGNIIGYQTAYSNTHGTPDYAGQPFDDRHDPFYCSLHPSDCTGVYAHPDDRAWSQQVVAGITTLLTSVTNGSPMHPTTVTYNYSLAVTGHNTTTCNPLPNDTDCVGDNWIAKNTTTGVVDGDWADYNHAEFRGFNVVYATDTSGETTVDSYYSTKGWATGNSDASNYNVGHIYQEDIYQNSNVNGTFPLRTTITQYTGDCRSGSSSCPSPTYPNSCNGTYNATYAPCEVMALWSLTSWPEGISTTATLPNVKTEYTYDDYNPLAPPAGSGLIPGNVYHNLTQEVITPLNSGKITKKWAYATVDTTVGTWVYYDVNKVAHSEVDDAGGHIYQCQYTTYDEGAPNGFSAGWPTTVKTYQSSDCGNTGATALTTGYAGYDAYGNPVANVDGVGASNSGLYSSAGCSASPTIHASAWSSGHYTSCTTYDSYEAQPTNVYTTVSGTVTLSASVTYDTTQGNIPVSSLDANGRPTSVTYSYDSSGNSTISTKLPAESGSYTTQSTGYATCGTTSLTTSAPCYQIDNFSAQYPNALSQTYYDGLGRAVQSSTPVPPPVGADTSKKYFEINLTYYNDTTHSVYQFLPFILVGNTTIGGNTGVNLVDASSTVQDYAGNTLYGSATYYDALGRTVGFDDPTFNAPGGGHGVTCVAITSITATTCTSYTSTTSPSGVSNNFETATTVDPNNHVTKTYLDELGETRYVEHYSGVNGGTLTLNEQLVTQYSVLGEPLSVVTTDLASPTGSNQSVTATSTYDDLGRLLTHNDPDKGTHTYTYDGDSHVLTDVSGTRTLGYNYDLGGRIGCVQSGGAPTINASGACTTGTQPLVHNFYDTSALTISGTTDYPLGRLNKSIATTVYNDGTKSTATTLYEHDPRGRLKAEQVLLTVPGSWNVTTALPTYQEVMTYNDADQLVTLQPKVGATLSPSTTQVYDLATGVPTGLSNNGNTVTANLATVGYNAHMLPDTLTFLSSTGSAIASEQLSYDNNLRPTRGTACWQSIGCAGTNGTIFGQTVTYDAASNVTSNTLTLDPVNGVSNTGGSETQNFCYDEQNRLIWSGNSSAPPSAGNGTCGSATSQSGLHGASYTNSFVYTHLGQLYQAPLGGGTPTQQYLYCDSTHPHQLTGIYPLGTTCAQVSGGTASPNYVSYYDAWGNVRSRTTGGIPAFLYYDALDHFTEWNASSNGHEWYVYDASGERILKRSTNASGTTTLTAYPFGDEHSYDSTGTNTIGNTYYYSLAGRLIGELTGTSSTSTQYFLQDILGSPLATFSNAAGTTTVLGNQVYGPYGNQRYQGGSMGTTRGFTGQYNDSLSGIDYYGARYYDPKAGVFLSADSVEGNMQGMNPYGYVGGNPETMTDPTGQRYLPDESCVTTNTCPAETGPGLLNPNPPIAPTGGGGKSGGGSGKSGAGSGGAGAGPKQPQQKPKPPSPPAWITGAIHILSTIPGISGQLIWEAIDIIFNVSGIWNDVQTLLSDKASWWDKIRAGGDLALSIWNDINMLTGAGEAERAAQLGEELATGGEEDAARLGADACGGGLSFRASTQVATKDGEQAIGTLTVGEQVWAYNPTTKKMELQPILHVWINHDNDLVDLTITTQDGKGKAATSEVIHTNKKHPFLTLERGFVVVASIVLGMHILQANGQVGVVTGWTAQPGSSVMYNLEVAQDHTFVVGDGQWVVHNCDASGLPDSGNKIDGQDNLYSGQQVDTDQLSARGWKMVRNDVRSYVSDNFKSYLRSRGKNPSDFRYYMQTWRKGNATIENHYWYDMYDPDFGAFHHH